MAVAHPVDAGVLTRTDEIAQRLDLLAVAVFARLANINSRLPVLPGPRRTDVAGGHASVGYDDRASMDSRHHSVPVRPQEWQPLVSPRQWAILAHALADGPEVLEDLHIVLTQLSPGVRAKLVANLVTALESGARPTRAVWMALAITGDEVKLCSAAALGRLHALADDVPGGAVHRLWPKE